MSSVFVILDDKGAGVPDDILFRFGKIAAEFG